MAAWTGTEVVVVGGWEDLCPPGADCNMPSVSFTDGAAFDPTAGTWRPIAPAPVGVVGTRASVVAGDVYLLAGCRTINCADSAPVVLRYRPDPDTWDAAHRSPVERSGLPPRRRWRRPDRLLGVG